MVCVRPNKILVFIYKIHIHLILPYALHLPSNIIFMKLIQNFL